MKAVFIFPLCLVFVCTVSAQTQYFPPRVFCAHAEPGGCERWYAKHLVAMEEPSLWEFSKASGTESYRFLWLRTFHRPISARLEVTNDGSAVLFVKVLSGQGGYEPGNIVENRKLAISKGDVDHFEKLLQEAQFWDAPAERAFTGVIGADGAQWIIEAAKAGQYHVVDRWCPENRRFRAAALFLAIKLGGLSIPKSEVY
jgi:hypothetical protein